MASKKAKVLVVGGAGYVGCHAAKALARAGHEVTVFDDLSTGHGEFTKFGKFIEGSILDGDALAQAITSTKPDCVMHFAAKALVGESMEDPALYYRVNVAGSLNLFEGLRLLAPKAVVVFSSTCSLYGSASGKLSENLPIAPMNTYANTKKIIEDLLTDYGRAYGLRSVCLRYFNAAGADSEGEIGELHEPETHLIPRLLYTARGDFSEEVKIYGNDYPTRDGTCIRDYIHVEDLADAHLRAMDYLLKGGASDVFNLGTTQGASVMEVVRMVESVTGKKLNLKVGTRRPGDPPELVADSGKAAKVLGWKAEHDLESVVRTAWNFAKRHKG